MPIKVIELFAGVGGFRIGLEGYPKQGDRPFETIWSNQFEPKTKTQHASMVYEARWPDANHDRRDIAEVIENDFESIPHADMLVGGFPCQDYSVATSLKNSKGLRGKKGVLWWSIEAILRKQGEHAPKILLLENVDRLLKSPADQRGRDFAVMLSSLGSLGYSVEWKVINAADYGMPQRRRRVFILAYKKGTKLHEQSQGSATAEWIGKNSPLARAFPATLGSLTTGEIRGDLDEISQGFNKKGKLSPFKTCGVFFQGEFHTASYSPDYNDSVRCLEDVLVPLDEVPAEYFIPESDLEHPSKGWRYQKGAKRIQRTNALGESYTFSEGALTFPDALDRPSRTIITGEGGAAPSRFKHVVEQEGRFRRLTPVELERLNMFPDDHTKLEGISDSKRAFFMGNALVTGVVGRIAEELEKLL